MKNLLLALTCLLIFIDSNGQNNQVQADNRTISFVPKINTKGTPINKSVTVCSNDTIEYSLAKATGLQALNLNNTTSGRAVSQYFNAPQNITVHGATFYAYKIDAVGGITLNATVELYLAATDSTPTGVALASGTISVDTTFGGGTLAFFEKNFSFFTPVTVSQPYVIVIGNNSPNSMGMVFNSWTAVPANGSQEWLSSVQIGANWLRSYNVNVGGVPLDADALVYPHVSYDLNVDFTANPLFFNTAPTNVNFTNNSSPLLQDRMYNQTAYLGSSQLSYSYDFGDGSPSVSAINTNHSYTIAQPYTATLTNTLSGWRTTCTGSETVALNTDRLVITEIMYNPPESGTDSLEFIELYNNGLSNIDLNGFYFSQGISHTFGSGLLAPNTYYTICVDSQAFNNVFGYAPDAEWNSGGLNNGGDDIVIKNSVGLTLDSVNYSTIGAWPSGTGAGDPNGGGASIVLCDVNTDNNNGNNWSASTKNLGVVINTFTLFASPGTYGCCATLTGFVSDSICSNGIILINGTIYNAINSTGSEVFTNIGPNMCDSTVTIALNLLPAIDISVINTTPTLTANQTGASFRWLNCDNGNAVIPGATGMGFTATTGGNYAVEITLGNCTDTSACESIHILGINKIETNEISIYPNPTKNSFNVNFNSIDGAINYTLTAIDGRIIEQQYKYNIIDKSINIDLSNHSKGLYLLKIENKTSVKTFKITKH